MPAESDSNDQPVFILRSAVPSVRFHGSQSIDPDGTMGNRGPTCRRLLVFFAPIRTTRPVSSPLLFLPNPNPGRLLLSAAIGKKTEVADANEASRQDVQQKPPDQLFYAQIQDLVSIVIVVIFVPQTNLILLDSDDPPIAKRDLLTVTTEVIDNRSGSWWPIFGIDDAFVCPT